MNKSALIRLQPLDTPACEVARTLGVLQALVRVARTRGARRGRPSSRVDTAEACARLLEGRGESGMAALIRSGAWRQYTK